MTTHQPRPMSAPRECEQCGVAFATLDDTGRCPRCREVDAFAGQARAEVAAHMLDAALREALTWLHPGDVEAITAGAVAEHGDQGLDTLEALADRSAACSQARHEARVDQALAELLTHPRKD